MFDTMKIAQMIKQARIYKNMTQMNLADAMGVSYQAVSNWERGNSMPDISKLGDLCEILGISVNDLLGIEAPVVFKAMGKEELTVEELEKVAPMLPPVEVKKCTEKARRRKKLNLSGIMHMVAFLDQEYLEELVSEAEVDDLWDVVAVAPFLSQEVVDNLVKRCADMQELDSLTALAAFVSKETLDVLIDRYVETESDADLSEIYPFLSKRSVRKLAEYMIRKEKTDKLEGMMVFM